ncbi:MAG: flagellar hook-basal body complex protein [Pseudomonadota bacterium]
MDKSSVPVLLSGQRLQGRRVEMIANNLANLSTDGFRAQRALASEVVLSRGGPSLSLARFASAITTPEQGAVRRTGAPLDLAIQGEGFFQLEQADGTRLLSRAGRFVRGVDGAIVSPDGARLLGLGGAPLQLDPAGGLPEIAADGTITQDGVPQGQVAVFDAPPRLERLGRAAFAAPAGLQPIVDGRVSQGMLEGANVEPVSELAAMIDASRRYELVQGLMDREDGRVRNLIETFARAS